MKKGKEKTKKLDRERKKVNKNDLTSRKSLQGFLFFSGMRGLDVGLVLNLRRN